MKLFTLFIWTAYGKMKIDTVEKIIKEDYN